MGNREANVTIARLYWVGVGLTTTLTIVMLEIMMVGTMMIRASTFIRMGRFWTLMVTILIRTATMS